MYIHTCLYYLYIYITKERTMLNRLQVNNNFKKISNAFTEGFKRIKEIEGKVNQIENRMDANVTDISAEYEIEDRINTMVESTIFPLKERISKLEEIESTIFPFKEKLEEIESTFFPLKERIRKLEEIESTIIPLKERIRKLEERERVNFMYIKKLEKAQTYKKGNRRCSERLKRKKQMGKANESGR